MQGLFQRNALMEENSLSWERKWKKNIKWNKKKFDISCKNVYMFVYMPVYMYANL